ncbi:MAG TPA: SUMF1/EgtB/PvdO family nonheme iron enzyme [Candidatus Marinimicrobia bacterium]|nr:SUMF1/EgtB/PvdO family nonheme iron enzyme [Candidatus Neomarinimicrobiota bacterium]
MRKFLFIIGLLTFVMFNAQVKIAVIDFEGKNVPKTDASALTDRLRAELFRTGKFLVLEREKMDAILKEQQFQLSGCTSDACVIEAGELLAVEQVVSGSVSKVGQTYSVTARLISIEKGNLLGVGTCDLKGDISDVITCLNEVAEQLAGNQTVHLSNQNRIQEAQTNGLPEMVFIKGGTFQMGCQIDYCCCYKEETPVHTVTVSDFWMGKYEVTIAEFEKFISETGYQTFGDLKSHLTFNNLESVYGVNWSCDEYGNMREKDQWNYPVIYISWNDANSYCEWLSKKTGKKYRLPTEAEWEYAARSGGKDYKYSWGNSEPSGKYGGNICGEEWGGISEDRYYKGYDDGYVMIAPVGSFEPNELGLYDMTGNVLEWCLDDYDEEYYQKSPQYNPCRRYSDKLFKVTRGGSFMDRPVEIRCTFRQYGPADWGVFLIGFRLVRVE